MLIYSGHWNKWTPWRLIHLALCCSWTRWQLGYFLPMNAPAWGAWPDTTLSRTLSRGALSINPVTRWILGPADNILDLDSPLTAPQTPAIMSLTKAQKASAAKLKQFHQLYRWEPEEDGDAVKTGGEQMKGDTDRLLEVITFCQTLLTAQIEEVKVNISLIRQDFQKLRDRVKTAETRLGFVEDAILPL